MTDPEMCSLDLQIHKPFCEISKSLVIPADILREVMGDGPINENEMGFPFSVLSDVIEDAMAFEVKV